MTTRPLLSQIVTRTAERFPDREAFRCSGTPLTYADLDRRTSQLAHGLRELGVARGDRVGIFLRKGLDAAVALHGILKSGAAYVPIDPAIPADRLAFILRDCGIRHLITESAHLRVIAAAVTVAPELRPILIGIPLSYSISDGLALGFIAYSILKLASGRVRRFGGGRVAGCDRIHEIGLLSESHSNSCSSAVSSAGTWLPHSP